MLALQKMRETVKKIKLGDKSKNHVISVRASLATANAAKMSMKTKNEEHEVKTILSLDEMRMRRMTGPSGGETRGIKREADWEWEEVVNTIRAIVNERLGGGHGRDQEDRDECMEPLMKKRRTFYDHVRRTRLGERVWKMYFENPTLSLNEVEVLASKEELRWLERSDLGILTEEDKMLNLPLFSQLGVADLDRKLRKREMECVELLGGGAAIVDDLIPNIHDQTTRSLEISGLSDDSEQNCNSSALWGKNITSTPVGNRIRIFGGSENLTGVPNALGALEGWELPVVIEAELLTTIGITAWPDVGLPECPYKLYLLNVYKDSDLVVIVGHKVLPADEWEKIKAEEADIIDNHNFTI